jgi:hypothetical protein
MEYNNKFEIDEIIIEDRKTVNKAMINSTGRTNENQLPELLKAYAGYRTVNNLWEVVK